MSNNKDIYGKIMIYNETNSRTVPKTDSIVDSIVDKFIDRSRVGKAKYGVTLDREDLSLYDWCEHMQQELMDAVNYIEKIKVMLGNRK